MFYLILRLLHDELSNNEINKSEYFDAVIKISMLHNNRSNQTNGPGQRIRIEKCS